MIFKHASYVAALFCGALLTVGIARADGWPASVAGNWNVVGNQSTGILAITQSPGSVCDPIHGTIFGTDTIERFYCPGSGRIAFLRYNGNATSPQQFWSGNLSVLISGQPLRIGGLFAVFNASGGSLGEYNFSATK